VAFDSHSSESGSGFAFNPALLKEALKHQLPAEPFERLLKPIELHVPLDDFHNWLEHLRWMRKYDWGEMTNSQLILPTGIINALKARTRKGRIDKWSRTVALLTMLLVTSSTGHAWDEEILNTYLSRADQNFVEAVVSLLDALYQDRAQRAPAGPLAFYWLSQAAVLLPSVVAQCRGPTRTYFEWLAYSSGKGSRPLQDEAPDRVLGYLMDRIADKKGEVTYRQPRRLLTKRERVRLFFGENKNQWTGGAVVRLLILLLALTILPFGGFLWWKAQAMHKEAQQLFSARDNAVVAARAAFVQSKGKAP
jgi:hypothetical protein